MPHQALLCEDHEITQPEGIGTSDHREKKGTDDKTKH